MHIALKLYMYIQYLHDDHSYSNVNQDHYIVKRCTRIFFIIENLYVLRQIITLLNQQFPLQ